MKQLRIYIKLKSLEHVEYTFDHPAFTIVQDGKFIIYDYDNHETVAQYDLHDIEDATTYNY